MPHLVLIQPDIAQNLGAVLRLAACFALPVHVIEPCGFPLDSTRLKRAGMDYIQHVTLTRHLSWPHFRTHHAQHPGRLLLAETDGTASLYDLTLTETDYLLFGSEGSGTPRALYADMDTVFTIPMRRGMRSLNIATSTAITTAEAYRQLRWPL